MRIFFGHTSKGKVHHCAMGLYASLSSRWNYQTYSGICLRMYATALSVMSHSFFRGAVLVWVVARMLPLHSIFHRRLFFLRCVVHLASRL